jgi:benzoate membrane transport protein
VRTLLQDFSAASVTAGFVAVLVGTTSSVAIVFQAAAALGATPEQATSWIWALGLGMGATSIGLSLWARQPVLTAWSTPGAALLATAGAGVPMGEAIGAFLLCSLLITLAGATGWFERVMDRIPQALASALLAGVLVRFALDAFLAAGSQTALVLGMLLVYLAGRRWWPRYAVPGVLVVGVALAASLGLLNTAAWQQAPGGLAWPVFTAPSFSVQAMLSIALPLFVVTMASQNLPGVAAQRAAGYHAPVSRALTTTGLAGLLLAPFGGYAFNLAAITAAICMGPEAHSDASKRYTAAVAAGAFYVLLGLFGAAVIGLLATFPKEMVLALAGFALLSTIGNSLAAAVADSSSREAALITFLVTASGLVLWGVGSAFWGVVAGVAALAITRWRTAP